jgi:hypothetical protein
VVLRSGQVNEYLLRDPLDTASVVVSNSKIEINEVFYIRNVIHQITRDGWEVTLELWKGR